jgi:hypothetical protein
LYRRFLSRLHSVFNKSDPVLLDFLKAEGTVYENWLAKLEETRLLRILDNATGLYLDEYGVMFDEPRRYSETDNDYRVRLKLCLRGKGVTRPKIKQAVDYILSPQACAVIKWDDNAAMGQLDRYEFEVQLPVKSMGGFILNQSYLGQDTYLRLWERTKLLWDLEKIRRTVEKLKSSGATFRLTGGGELYE